MVVRGRSRIRTGSVKGPSTKAKIKLDAKIKADSVKLKAKIKADSAKTKAKLDAASAKAKAKVDAASAKAKTKADAKAKKADAKADAKAKADLDTKANKVEPTTKKGASAKKKYKTFGKVLAVLGMSAIAFNAYVDSLPDCHTVEGKEDVCGTAEEAELCFKDGKEINKTDPACSRYKNMSNFLPVNLDSCFSYVFKDEKGECYGLNKDGVEEKLDADNCAYFSKTISDSKSKECDKFGEPTILYNKLVGTPRECFVYSKLDNPPTGKNKAFQRKLTFPKTENKCKEFGTDGHRYSLNTGELLKCTTDIQMILEPRNPICDKFGKPGQKIKPITTRPSPWDVAADCLLNPSKCVKGTANCLLSPISCISNLAGIDKKWLWIGLGVVALLFFFMMMK